MVSYYALKEFGESLRRSKHTHLALADLTSMLRQGMNVHTDKTIRHYLVTLEESGYLRRVSVNGAPRFEVVRPAGWEGSRDLVDERRKQEERFRKVASSA